MEELQKSEKKQKKFEDFTMDQMQSSFMNSSKPLRDTLFYYNKASVKGFNSSLVTNTLGMIKKILRARGNLERPYEDYSTKDLDISWRMQMLSSHIKSGLEKDMYFNHYYMSQSSRLLGDIGFKDSELIQKFFDKLNYLIDERESKDIKQRPDLNYQEILYGSFLNFMPRHYIFDGFESSEEFREHLKTLIEWDVERKNGLQNLGVEPTESVKELEISLAQLIESVNQIKHLQINIQASIDSLRQQLFKLQEAKDKYAWMSENKFIHLELLQLQELLVKAGYIRPEEADKFSSQQPFEVRMENASQIFYDYVQNFAPELISTNYKDYFFAADESLSNRNDKKIQFNIDEEHDKLSLSSLSQTLIGLYRQALSYRKDSQGKDYLHKFYEDHANQGESLPKNHEEIFYQNNFDSVSQHLESKVVKMERDYLRAYTIFNNEVEKIWPRLINTIDQNKIEDFEGQLHSLLALSCCKIEDQKTRQLLIEQINQNIRNKKKARPQALIDGLTGIALQFEITPLQQETAKQLLHILKSNVGKRSETNLNFDQKLDILWAACALQLEGQNSLIKDLYLDLHQMNFQRINNDLTFEQFQKIRDFTLYLTEVSDFKNLEWIQKDQNSFLEFLAKNPHFHEKSYEETTSNFDPFKKRVLLAISKGLSQGSFDYQISLENNLLAQADQDLQFNDNLYPYKPDIIFGYNGQKILLSVIKTWQTMRDVQKPDGSIRFRQRILEGLHQNNQKIKSVCVPISSIVKYDIENLKIEINSQYDFLEDIKRQIDNFKQRDIDFKAISQFGSEISKQASIHFAVLKDKSDQQRLGNFLKQLFRLFQIKQETEKQYKQEVYLLGLNMIKFELMKLDLYFQSLPNHQQQFINQFIPQQFKNFKDMIIEQRELIKQVKNEKNEEIFDPLIDFRWIGVRQEVELPQILNFQSKKSIVPEMINQKFMWCDDYFHYEDWQQQQKQVFNSFDLLVIPKKQNDYKYFYNRGTFQRLVPQGIFPQPNQKREILIPNIIEFSEELSISTEKQNDVLNQFEKDPFKIMIQNELNKSKDLLPLTQKLSFMTNLQNIKQGLKQDYSDQEILDLILLRTEFTEKIIEQHLQQSKQNQQNNTLFIERDPSAFREFLRKIYLSKDQEDPFTHFYLKESGKIEKVHQFYNQKKKEFDKFLEQNPEPSVKIRTEELQKTIHQKVEDMLLENDLENNDNLSLSHQMDSKVQIQYNLKSLIKSEFVFDLDPDLDDKSISDYSFLELQRKRAETKLIKSKILYKQHLGHQLSQNENKYLQKWINEIQNNDKINIFNLRDSMIPQNYSKLNISESLSAEDIYTFNQIPKVKIDRNKHEKFAINDIILEMSHFLDEEVINRVEMQIISKKVQKDWDLPADFQIIETRNKEISHVFNELEELAWRMAGQLNQKDVDALKAILSIQRNQDHFDKKFYDTDIKSLTEFIKVANLFDNRINFLEEWIIRKEEEIKQRKSIPPKNLQLSDQEIYKKIEKKQQKAREFLVANLLQEEENGNQQNKVKRTYQNLTKKDLEKISEQLVLRLNLFQGEYPTFMPAVIKGIMEHPNISRSDFQMIDSYCQIFELDWRGDYSVKNKKEFLATNPIYLNFNDLKSNFEGYGTVGNFEVTAMIQQACIPFVEDLAQSLVNQADLKKSF